MSLCMCVRFIYWLFAAIYNSPLAILALEVAVSCWLRYVVVLLLCYVVAVANAAASCGPEHGRWTWFWLLVFERNSVSQFPRDYKSICTLSLF